MLVIDNYKWVGCDDGFPVKTPLSKLALHTNSNPNPIFIIIS